MSWEQIRCVVLNPTYEPLNIVSARKAFMMWFEGKADVLEIHPEVAIHTVSTSWEIPVQVILKRYVKMARPAFRVPAKLGASNKNLFIRDKHTCQYCGRHKSLFRTSEKLTRDHVVPTSRGGRDVWDNVVAACSTCNNRKADNLLEEIEMKLIKKPSTPTLFEIWSKSDSNKFMK